MDFQILAAMLGSSAFTAIAVKALDIFAENQIYKRDNKKEINRRRLDYAAWAYKVLGQAHGAILNQAIALRGRPLSTTEETSFSEYLMETSDSMLQVITPQDFMDLNLVTFYFDIDLSDLWVGYHNFLESAKELVDKLNEERNGQNLVSGDEVSDLTSAMLDDMEFFNAEIWSTLESIKSESRKIDS